MAVIRRDLVGALLLWVTAAQADVALPDVIEDAQAASQMQWPTAIVTAPPKLLPSNNDIKAMPESDRAGRKHFYASAFILMYLGVLVLGTFILSLGTSCKNRGVKDPERIMIAAADVEEADDGPALPPPKAGLSRR